MEKIASFKIDHDKLDVGFYLSRADGNVSTYDLRFKKPNGGDYLSIAAIHTIEHLFATTVRSLYDSVVYFGPMGCRTGFYLLLFDTDYIKAREMTIESLKACLKPDEIPGNKRKECGNYRSHSLTEAKREIEKYLSALDRSPAYQIYSD